MDMVDLGFFNPQEVEEIVEENDEVVIAVDSLESEEVEEPVIKSLNQLLKQKNLDYREIVKTLKAHPAGILTLEHRNFEEKLWQEFKSPSDSLTVLLAVLAKDVALIEKDNFILLRKAIEIFFNVDYQERSWLISFLIRLFAQLEIPVIRSEMLKLVSIGIWNNLSEEKLQSELDKSQDREKLWSRYVKKLKAAKGNALQKMEMERNFLSSLLIDLVKTSNLPSNDNNAFEYCEKILELLIDLESQLPTRRFFHALLLEYNIIPVLQNSRMFKGADRLFLKLVNRLDFYIQFQIDDVTGVSLSRQETAALQHEFIGSIQKACFVKYPEELEEIIFASIGSLVNPKSLANHLEKLPVNILMNFAKIAGIRDSDIVDEKTLESNLLIKCIVYALKKRPVQIEEINSESLYPDENCIFDDDLIPNNTFGSENRIKPSSVPKLNIQFLTLHDYLLRNFQLYKLEAAYSIRQDIQDAILRVNPVYNPDSIATYDKTIFTGWARMATPLYQLQIEEVGTPRLTETVPSFVKADITYSLERYRPEIADEWDNLRPHDTLLLISLQLMPDLSSQSVTQPLKKVKNSTPEDLTGQDFKKRYGIKHVRGCEIFQILGDDGNPVYDFKSAKELDKDGVAKISSKSRTLRVLLDCNQYVDDLKSSSDIYDIYGNINLIVRRNASQNNFKSVLETIRDLMQSELVVPEWLQDILLGYGDRDSAHFTKMANPTRNIDFGYTFLNWEHLVSSFPEKQLIPIKEKNSPDLIPPYMLSFPKEDFAMAEENDDEEGLATKKRKSDSSETGIIVKSYRFKSLIESPKINKIAFTPAQVQAIRSGSSTGLSLIVGPPGTGKTDVAVQIISNLYRQNSNCHMLLITRSNQALNHLFEKISASNINPRHLVRLGHGHEDLDSTEEWGKAGRINSFLELRTKLLEQVELLASSMMLPKEHAGSCETASYFFNTNVKPLHDWFKEKILDDGQVTIAKIVENFPFTGYFSKISPALFSKCTGLEHCKQLAEDFCHHIVSIFEEIDQVRPFELLRSNKDRSNYLLVKEARIIAMTSTHASLKRRELVRLGFKYDTVIMEEAGQMLEVETFIPLLLQSHDTDLNSSPLSRVILIGDHHQLPPIVQNQYLCQTSKMDQSLFARLIRLGVPTIDLDYQGRARSSIADLYRWNYKDLKDLPLVQPEFEKHNAGFVFEYQAINVEDYNGVGESFPRPHYVQNLGEAEYVVATYMYMRLLGYPKESIAILSTYNGQKELIRDILNKRCRFNPLFGVPKVSTVDQFQGQQAKYILLSLVRSKSVGHVRDVRRLIVALSRSRLGLYVFCRASLFKDCKELSPAFNVLLSRPTTLQILPDERYGSCSRLLSEKPVKGKSIKDVVELGKLVVELGNAKTLLQ